MSLPSSPTRTAIASTPTDLAADTVIEKLIELIQVTIEQIWYYRGVYPEASFEKRRAFGLQIYANTHPGVQQYLKDAVLQILQLLKKGKLKRLFVDLYDDDRKTESYALSFTNSILFEYLQQGAPVHLDSAFSEALLTASLQSLLYSLIGELAKLGKPRSPPDFKLLIASDDSIDTMMQDSTWVLEATNMDEAAKKKTLKDVSVHTLHEVNLGYLLVKGYTATMQ